MRIASLLVVVGLGCGPALAQTSLWVAGDGDWFNVSNWSPAEVPDSPAESAELAGFTPYAVALDQGIELGSLDLYNPFGAIDLTGAASLIITAPSTNNGRIALPAGSSLVVRGTRLDQNTTGSLDVPGGEVTIESAGGVSARLEGGMYSGSLGVLRLTGADPADPPVELANTDVNLSACQAVIDHPAVLDRVRFAGDSGGIVEIANDVDAFGLVLDADARVLDGGVIRVISAPGQSLPIINNRTLTVESGGFIDANRSLNTVRLEGVGTTVLESGGVLESGTFALGPDHTLAGTGMFFSPVGGVTFNGTIAPGLADETGALTIDVRSSGGINPPRLADVARLRIRIMDTPAGLTHDQLLYGGAGLFLGGTLVLEVQSAEPPPIGTTFEIIKELPMPNIRPAGGGFDAVESDLDSSRRFVVRKVRGSIFVDVVAGCLAIDLNQDGELNNADVNLFVSLFLAGDPLTDFSGDGVLNNADINLFVGQFLNGC